MAWLFDGGFRRLFLRFHPTEFCTLNASPRYDDRTITCSTSRTASGIPPGPCSSSPICHGPATSARRRRAGAACNACVLAVDGSLHRGDRLRVAASAARLAGPAAACADPAGAFGDGNRVVQHDGLHRPPGHDRGQRAAAAIRHAACHPAVGLCVLPRAPRPLSDGRRRGLAPWRRGDCRARVACRAREPVVQRRRCLGDRGRRPLRASTRCSGGAGLPCTRSAF
jgi:hypothetical protein